MITLENKMKKDRTLQVMLKPINLLSEERIVKIKLVT